MVSLFVKINFQKDKPIGDLWVRFLFRSTNRCDSSKLTQQAKIKLLFGRICSPIIKWKIDLIWNVGKNRTNFLFAIRRIISINDLIFTFPWLFLSLKENYLITLLFKRLSLPFEKLLKWNANNENNSKIAMNINIQRKNLIKKHNSPKIIMNNDVEKNVPNFFVIFQIFYMEGRRKPLSNALIGIEKAQKVNV